MNRARAAVIFILKVSILKACQNTAIQLRSIFVCNPSSCWELKNKTRTRGCHFHPEGIFFKSLKG